MNVNQKYDEASLSQPDFNSVPRAYREDVENLFQVWTSTRSRNKVLTQYYNMKNELKDLGISVPESMLKVNCVVGWCKKAVDAIVTRSIFDGFAFRGQENDDLKYLADENRLGSKISQATKSSLVHGLSALTVMKGNPGEPEVMVRAFSANQFACLWDKDKERIGAGMVLADVDTEGVASKYVAFFDDMVLTMRRYGTIWEFTEEVNPMGRPLMEILVHDPDIDRPLGHSLLSKELRGIVDKAMRDVLRMEIGAEFFTFPQRYILGAQEDVFSAVPEGATQDEEGVYRDKDGKEVQLVENPQAKFKAYVGAILAFTRDENGEIPQVGQFSASTADNFTRVFENDAQRFSGATNVPLSQLGVLSNTYTSSDALGAANNPLILSVEALNRQYNPAISNIGRMMMAIKNNCTIEELPDDLKRIKANFKDPAMPTISAAADAATKLASADKDVIGTRVWYEMMGFSQATIDRLEAEKGQRSAIQALNDMADMMAQNATENAIKAAATTKTEE